VKSKTLINRAIIGNVVLLVIVLFFYGMSLLATKYVWLAIPLAAAPNYIVEKSIIAFIFEPVAIAISLFWIFTMFVGISSAVLDRK